MRTIGLNHPIGARLLLTVVCILIISPLLYLAFQLLLGSDLGITKFDSETLELDDLRVNFRLHDIDEDPFMSASVLSIGFPAPISGTKQTVSCVESLNVSHNKGSYVGVPIILSKLFKLSDACFTLTSQYGWIQVTIPLEELPALNQLSELSEVSPTVPVSGTLYLDTFYLTQRVDPLASPFSPSEHSEYILVGDTIPIQTAVPAYFFPFDKRYADLYISVNQTISDVQDEKLVISNTVSPEIGLLIESPEWTETVTFAQDEAMLAPWNSKLFVSVPVNAEQKAIFVQVEGSSEYQRVTEVPFTHLHIDFQRPLAFRVLSTTILTSLAVIMFLLMFVNDTSSFLEVAAGLVLGLWGVQNILIPNYITGTTIVHNTILVLYVLLAFVIFVRFVIRPVWYRLSPTSRSIHDKNTKQELLSPEPEPRLDPSSLPPKPSHPRTAMLTLRQLVSVILAAIAIIGLIQFIKREQR